MASPLDEITDELEQLATTFWESNQKDLYRLVGIVGGLARQVREIKSTAASAANTASCLANGILPD